LRPRRLILAAPTGDRSGAEPVIGGAQSQIVAERAVRL
jgi:hypothetical protein